MDESLKKKFMLGTDHPSVTESPQELLRELVISQARAKAGYNPPTDERETEKVISDNVSIMLEKTKDVESGNRDFAMIFGKRGYKLDNSDFYQHKGGTLLNTRFTGGRRGGTQEYRNFTFIRDNYNPLDYFKKVKRFDLNFIRLVLWWLLPVNWDYDKYSDYRNKGLSKKEAPYKDGDKPYWVAKNLRVYAVDEMDDEHLINSFLFCCRTYVTLPAYYSDWKAKAWNLAREMKRRGLRIVISNQVRATLRGHEESSEMIPAIDIDEKDLF